MTTTTPFSLKTGDTSPAIESTLLDSDGNAVDLTGASVQFTMAPKAVGAAATVDASATIVDAAAGTVRYDWSSGDTDVANSYIAEWTVTYADTTVETFPNDDYIPVKIRGSPGE